MSIPAAPARLRGLVDVIKLNEKRLLAAVVELIQARLLGHEAGDGMAALASSKGVYVLFQFRP